MASYFLSYFMTMLLLLGGNRGGTDLLETLPTEVYWQLKHVTPALAQLQTDAAPDPAPGRIDQQLKALQAEDFTAREKARRDLEAMGPAIIDQLRPATTSPDPEVSAVAAELIKRFSERSQERAIRRLMAIRTMGERKDAAALPALEKLTDSTDLFVAEYARRAIAQIKGEPYQRPDIAASMARDAAIVPADAALIAQSIGLNPDAISLAAVVDKIVDTVNSGGGMGAMLGGGGAPEKKLVKKDVLLAVAGKLLEVLERVGNVRLDGVTVGFTLKEDNVGWAVVTFRGQYDAARMHAVLQDLMGPDAKGASWYEPGAVRSLAVEGGQMVMLLPGNDQLIMLTGSGAGQTGTLKNHMLAALQNGAAAREPNEALATLLKTVDRKSPAWAAGILTKAMKEGDLEAFEKFTLQSKTVKDGIELTLKGSGADAQKVKTAVEHIDAGAQQMLNEIKQMLPAMPAMQPVVDVLSSVKVTADGKDAILTAQLKTGLLDALLSQIGPALLEEIVRPPRTPMPGEKIEVVPIDRNGPEVAIPADPPGAGK